MKPSPQSNGVQSEREERDQRKKRKKKEKEEEEGERDCVCVCERERDTDRSVQSWEPAHWFLGTYNGTSRGTWTEPDVGQVTADQLEAWSTDVNAYIAHEVRLHCTRERLHCTRDEATLHT
eukprot:2877144-Rhodomonas_salina.1